jgi:opacity protein-like surface antigen
VGDASLRQIPKHSVLCFNNLLIKDGMRRSTMKIARSVIVLVLASVAMASVQAANVYLGISGGQSDFNDACDGLSKCDDTDTALKVFMGVRNNNFGFEGAYVNLGEPTATHPSLGKINTSDIWGVQMQGVGILPFTNQLSGFAKVGGLFYEGSEIDSGAAWALGVGLQYYFNDTFGIRAEYEWFNNVETFNSDVDGNANGNDFSTEEDVSVISAGLVFNF